MLQTVQEVIAQIDDERAHSPNPDAAPSVAEANAIRRRKVVLTERAQRLRAAKAREEKAAAREAEMLTLHGQYLSVLGKVEDRISALDPAAVRDLHERRKAEHELEALRMAVRCLDVGWHYVGGHAEVPTVLEAALVAAGVAPLPGLSNVFDGRSGLRWVEGKLAEARKERAQAQEVIGRELAAHAAAAQS